MKNVRIFNSKVRTAEVVCQVSEAQQFEHQHVSVSAMHTVPLCGKAQKQQRRVNVH